MSPFPTKTLFLALFLSLIVLSDAKLRLASPNSLVKDPRFDPINGLDYIVLTPQNKVTYKRSLIGNAILAGPREDGCDYMEPVTTVGDDAVYNPFIVALWGECHYSQKVKNAELAGAKILVLVLNHDMPLNHPDVRELPMISNIEVIAVSQKDGDNLIAVLKEAATKPKGDPEAVVELAYSYEPK